MTGVRLHVVGWDHDRCMASLRALGEVWERLHGDEVVVTARPGLAFAEQPLDAAVVGVDVISIDHPFVGAAAQSGCLAALDGLVAPAVLDALAADAVGASHASYTYGGHQLAVATDAACQVAVVRDDLLGDSNTPRTLDDVLDLAHDSGGRVGMSFGGHDLICTLLAIAAAHGARVEPTHDRLADRDVALRAITWLATLADKGVPCWNGGLLDRMSSTDDILFAPFQWGYVTHSRPDAPGHRLRFADAPMAEDGTGSILGGAGLAVAAASAHPAEAAAFATWATGAPAQRTIVAPHRGQPGSRAVWDDPELDTASGGFYSATRATMERARVRPRDPWWPDVQRDCGELLARTLRAGQDPEAVLVALEAAYAAIRRQHDDHGRRSIQSLATGRSNMTVSDAPTPRKLGVSDLERIERYRRCGYGGSISDALHELGIDDTILSPRFVALRQGMQLVGRVLPVRLHSMVELDDPDAVAAREARWRAAGGHPQRRMMEAIAAAEDGTVLCFDCGGDTQTAHFGEMSCQLAYAHGCRGMLLAGNCRDTHYVLQMAEFPVYCFGTRPNAFGGWEIVDIDEPIFLPGHMTHYVRIMPGDFVFGDNDGVQIIPARVVDEVLLRAEATFEKENEERELLAQGMPIDEVYHRYGVL